MSIQKLSFEFQTADKNYDAALSRYMSKRPRDVGVTEVKESAFRSEKRILTFTPF